MRSTCRHLLLLLLAHCSCYKPTHAEDHEVFVHDQSTHCFSTTKVTWLNGNEGRIFMRDDTGGLHHLRLKGVSWHGLDTDTFSLNGLTETSMEHIVSALQARRFNAIRVPISLDFALQKSKRTAAYTDICGGEETAATQLHRLFKRAAAHGLLVMLDLHAIHARPVLNTQQGAPTTLFDAADVIRAWDEMLHDYLVHPNFFALDAFDGPHFSASWREKHMDYEAFLKQLAELLEQGHEKDGVTRWFKGLLGMKPHRERERKIADHLGHDQWKRRVVYTPQISGSRHQAFTAEEITSGAVAKSFAEAYGYLELQHGHAVVVANWVAHHSNRDDMLVGLEMDVAAEAQYLNLLAEWLRASGLTDVFWNLDPSEMGLLRKDWTTFASCRLDLLEKVNPAPTRFAHINSDEICVAQWGADTGPRGAAPDFTELDCTDPKDSSRCVTCTGAHTKQEVKTAAVKAMRAGAPGEGACVPQTYYDDLSKVDESDRRLRYLSAKHTQALAKGTSKQDELDSMQADVAAAAKALTSAKAEAQATAAAAGIRTAGSTGKGRDSPQGGGDPGSEAKAAQEAALVDMKRRIAEMEAQLAAARASADNAHFDVQSDL